MVRWPISQERACATPIERARRMAIQMRALSTLLMEPTAARRGLHTLEAHGLWRRENPRMM